MYTRSIHTALDIALSNESTQSYNRAIKNIYIIGASQAIMSVFDKNPDEVERDIRMSVQALELEED